MGLDSSKDKLPREADASRDLIPYAPWFYDETAARLFLEAQRWPNGRACAWCASLCSRELPNPGWFECSHCDRNFHVVSGTVMEGSQIDLTGWLIAHHLVSQGVSTLRISFLLRFSVSRTRRLVVLIEQAVRLGGLTARLSSDLDRISHTVRHTP